MSRPQSRDEGEAPDSHGGSKVTSERVALLVVCSLLGAALIVIYRLSFELINSRETLRNITVIKDQPALKCEAGWERHGGTCYYFIVSKSSWNGSRAACRAEGGDLVKIDSLEEQQFLVQRLSHIMKKEEDKFWTGLSDSAAEGRWLWVDGSPLNKSLTFWAGNEPDNWKKENPDGEDCMRMGEKSDSVMKCWFDKSCNELQKAICEKPAGTGR